MSRPAAVPAAERAARTPRHPVHGVLLLDKPRGMSSNAALQQARRMYRAEKAGHTGTLDPFAEGLLLVCFGEASKFSSWHLHADKVYRAELRLGVRTSTGDPEGETLSERPVGTVADDLPAILDRFRGEISQIPPMYSALKHDGRPLYEYARAGIEIPRQARSVRIHALELLDFAAPVLRLQVHCSAGTYIRTLAEDIGEALGCGAHLTRLERLESGGICRAAARTLDWIEAAGDAERGAALQPPDALLQHLPRYDAETAQVIDLLCGRRPAVTGLATGLYRVYGEGRFAGLAECGARGIMVPQRMMSAGQVVETG